MWCINFVNTVTSTEYYIRRNFKLAYLRPILRSIFEFEYIEGRKSGVPDEINQLLQLQLSFFFWLQPKRLAPDLSGSAARTDYFLKLDHCNILYNALYLCVCSTINYPVNFMIDVLNANLYSLFYSTASMLQIQMSEICDTKKSRGILAECAKSKPCQGIGWSNFF